MNASQHLFKKAAGSNLLVIVVLVILAALIALPHIMRYWQLGNKYTILFFDNPTANQLNWEETYTYATQVNRIKNNQPINDPYIFEYRDKPSPLISVLGIAAKLFSVPFVFVLVKIILIPIVVLIWYLIAREIGYSKTSSAAAAIMGVILQKTYAYIPYINKFYNYHFNGYFEIQRIYFPLISSFSISLTILLVIKLMKADIGLFKKILAGLLFGSLFYTYFFAWTLFWTSFAFLVVTLLFKKQYKIAKRLIIPFVAAALVAAPYFINLFLFSQNPAREAFILRTIAFPISDWNLLVIIRFLILISVLIITNRSWLKVPARYYLIIFLVSALFLSPLSKLALGADYQSDHWYERFLYPLSTFLFTLVVFDIMAKFKPKLLSSLAFILIFVCLSKVIFVTVGELGRDMKNFRIGPAREDLYAWMLPNIPKDSVIATLSFTESVYITAYTPFYSYLPQAYKTIAPESDLLTRYVNLVRIYGADESFIKQTFIMPNAYYADKKSIVSKDGNGFMMLEGIATHFDPFPYPQHKNIQNEIIKMSKNKIKLAGRIDYLLFGPLERENAKSFDKNHCKILYSNGLYQVYEFKSCQIDS